MRERYDNLSEDVFLITELSTSYPKAAKDYKCDLCGQPITKGQRHIKYVYIDDDNHVLRTTRCHHSQCWLEG